MNRLSTPALHFPRACRHVQVLPQSDLLMAKAARKVLAIRSDSNHCQVRRESLN
jgi:hypothetical protein